VRLPTVRATVRWVEQALCRNRKSLYSPILLILACPERKCGPPQAESENNLDK